MHVLIAGDYTALAGEINALYHEAAVRAGISDSVQNILYVLCEEQGHCPQSEIARRTGISRQTINSAIRKLEKDGIIVLEPGKGRNTIVCLTEKGQCFAEEKIAPLFAVENKIWNEWTEEEQRTYLNLTKKYRDALKRHMASL
ncbi:MAG: winged helix-turn-helix transcriptional regulator [Peptococcaceae bacterium]|nr:winged helix-turn-helix transcriptional regulator [Peptococcaceae bacterium]